MTGVVGACRVCLREAAATRLLPSADCRTFFTQLARLNDLPEVIFLCAWCRLSVRGALVLYERAVEADSLIRWIDQAMNAGQTVDDNSILNAKTLLQRDLYALSRSKTEFTIITGNTETVNETEADINYETSIVSATGADDGFSDSDDHPLSDSRAYALGKLKENETLEIVLKVEKENIVSNQQDNVPRKKKKRHRRLSSVKIDRTNGAEFENNKFAKRRQKEAAKCEMMQFQIVYLSLEEQFRQIEDNKMSEKYLKAKYRCEFCGVGFLTEDVHGKHMTRHDESFGSHRCDVCTLRFTTHEVLLQHVLAHRRYFRCLPCGAILRRRCHCSAHRAKCASIMYALECDYCQKVFGDPYSLKQHINGVHLKQKNYMCSYCQKKFTHKQKLVVHMRTHTGERPFQCAHCQKKFTTNSNLKAHLDTHTTSRRQYYCVECNSYFKTAKNLRRHFEESTKHQDKEKLGFSCSRCSLHFVTEKRLEAHVSFVHLGRSAHKCPTCGKGFASSGNLRKHTLHVHQHLRRAKDKICDVCGRGFALKRTLETHLNTHSGARPHQCDVCEATFAQPGAKYVHTRRVHGESASASW